MKSLRMVKKVNTRLGCTEDLWTEDEANRKGALDRRGSRGLSAVI